MAACEVRRFGPLADLIDLGLKNDTGMHEICM